MTPELRNLPHIASLAFNEPLLLEPAYARVFLRAGRPLGITRLTDTVSGTTLGTEQMAEPLMLFGNEEAGPRPARSYQVMNGIAVLPVAGTLVNKTRSLQPYSGMTGYNGVMPACSRLSAILMLMVFCWIWIRQVGWLPERLTAPTLLPGPAILNPSGRWRTMNCSAGQLIASAASRRLVTQTARTGSIGVMGPQQLWAGAEISGVEVTLIYSGDHKVDGNPYEKLPKMFVKLFSPVLMPPGRCLLKKWQVTRECR
jgi:hypothetical protein